MVIITPLYGLDEKRLILDNKEDIKQEERNYPLDHEVRRMKEYLGAKIEGVEEKSIAEELGLEAGDYLYKINGQVIRDFLDYQYLSCDEELDLEIVKASGEKWSIQIEKDEAENLGLEFLSPVFDGIRNCRNKCVFCFVDQMPPGMRSSLYCKDDDYRLSFLHGNYITLTNLKEEDIEKIIQYRLTPLYISIHATNPNLRIKMMNNPGANKIREQLSYLAKAGIQMNFQIVLCPGLNDQEVLDETINDLAKLYPQAISIAIVPVGLTKYRQGLYPLEAICKEKALQTINKVEEWQRKFKRELGTRLVFLSDELYLIAGLDFPKQDEYEDFPQIENGVGLARIFLDDFYKQERSLPKSLPKRRQVTIVSATSAAKFLCKVVERLNKIRNLHVSLEVIKNSFFGTSVTVTGLLTGTDILANLKHKNLGNELLIPRVVLKEGEEVFLDGIRLEDLKKSLNIPIRIIEDDAYDFVDKILEV